MEWVSIVLIVIPIFMPLIEELQIDLVWFCTVVPEWSLADIYAGMMQFMVIQVIGLLLVLAFPFIALWLPTVLFRGG